MIKPRILPKYAIRQYIKAYYRYKRLLEYYDWHYGFQLAQLQAENPQLFDRLEANYQANS